MKMLVAALLRRGQLEIVGTPLGSQMRHIAQYFVVNHQCQRLFVRRPLSRVLMNFQEAL